MKKLILLLLLIPAIVFGQKPSDYKPSTTSYVNDFEDIFTPEQEKDLDRIIRSFFDTVEMTVVTVPSFGDYPKDEFATQLGRQWGVGTKGNKGMVILLSKAQRQMFAATGTGLEGDMTDIQASQLQYDYAVPRFKEGNYYEGVRDLLNAYINYMSPSAKQIRKETELAEKAANARAWEQAKSVLINIILFIAFFGFLTWLVIYIRNRRIAIAKELADLQSKTDRAKLEVVKLQGLAVSATANGIPEGKELKDKILNFGLDPDVDIKSKQGYLNYLEKYNQLDKLTQELEDAILDKSNILRSAIDAKRGIRDVTSLRVDAFDLNTRLDAMVFNKDSYSSQIEGITDLIDQYSLVLTSLGDYQKDGKFDLMKAAVNMANQLRRAISEKFNGLEAIHQTDLNKIEKAKNARSSIMASISGLKIYGDKPGVSPETAFTCAKKLSAVEAKLKQFTGDIVNDYGLYLALTKELNDCTQAKTEHEAYLAEEERKRKAEEDRLRKIREEEKRREREEEEERNRIQRQADDDRRRSESYNSSSNDSYSGFSGGGFSGGGGGSSW